MLGEKRGTSGVVVEIGGIGRRGQGKIEVRSCGAAPTLPALSTLVEELDPRRDVLLLA